MARPVKFKVPLERAALELFVEQGVDGTSIRDISQRAGVTEGALYRHHPSKDALVRALFLQHLAGFAEAMRAAVEHEATAAGKLRAMIRRFLEFHDADPAVFEFLLITRHRVLDSVRQDTESPVDTLDRVMAEGMERGEWPRQDVTMASELCFGLVTQMAVAARFGRLARPLAGMSEDLFAACVAVLHRGSARPA
ncbi:MAG: helix-turn-helix domain-containing protein [Candidatus Sumerlaeia bacterium]|nr:helix-turn-helix domain-containing protein [Candidatus Sumerlaeia bacterium]